MSALAANRLRVAFGRMPEKPTPKRISEQAATGQALKRLRKRADMTQEQAAEKAGVVVQSWRRYEWGERELSLEKLAPLAAALGSSLDALLTERASILGLAAGATPEATILAWPGAERRGALDQPSVNSVLTIRDRIQAGAWLAADDVGQAEPRTWPAARDPRFAHAPQWLSEVVGDSVNLLRIYDGDLVHCIDTIAISYSPRTGDIVEVERLRSDGRERELTIKQVDVDEAGGVSLWPRSSNPRWQEPVRMAEGLAEGEEAEVRIRGLVISSIRRFG